MYVYLFPNLPVTQWICSTEDDEKALMPERDKER